MSPGDRPDLPLDSEPATVLRAATVGRPGPGPVQPVDHQLGIGEEPVLRFEVTGDPQPGPVTDTTPPDQDTAAPDGEAPSPHDLPATGPRLPLGAGLGAITLAWLLRRRSPHEV